jgi:protein-glutamine gamma-glutamyltransferase
LEDKGGWLRIDPTAAAEPKRIDDGIAAAAGSQSALPYLLRTENPLLRALRHRGLAISHAWNKWVLGYNADRQKDFMRELGLSANDWQSMVGLLLVLAVTWQAGVAALALRRRRSALEPAQKSWQRVQKHLGKAGLQQGSAEGPLDFAARALRLGLPVQDLDTLAARYAHLRYGPPPSDAALSEFDQQTRQWISEHPFRA